MIGFGIGSLLLDLLLTAILLKVVASVLPDFKIDGMGSALIAAAIATASGIVVPLIGLSPYLVGGDWIGAALRLGLSSVTLALGIAFAPGIRAGLLSVLLAAVIVSAASFGVMYAVGQVVGSVLVSR